MGKGGKGLTGADRAVWRKVAATTRPLPGRMETLLSSSAVANPVGAPAGNAQPEKPAANGKIETPSGITEAMRRALAQSFSGERDASFRSDPRPAGGHKGRSALERPVHRKLARGRLPLDDRLDLHGLGQEEAHARLRSFLATAQARDLRHVLVITGKGASFGSEGALKRAVPQWLALPDLAALVSGHEWAARGHGGEGALYIRLKRRRRPDR